MRNELERADRRARVASEKRKGRWAVNNPASLPEGGGEGEHYPPRHRQRGREKGSTHPPADETAAASPPRALDENQREEKVPLLRVGTPRRAMNWKSPADTPH